VKESRFARTFRKEAGGKRHWEGKQGQQQLFIKIATGAARLWQELTERRGELVERTLLIATDRECDAAPARTEEYSQTLLIHVGAFNISLVLRKMLGAGKPRELKTGLNVSFRE